MQGERTHESPRAALPGRGWGNQLSRHGVTMPRLWAVQPIYCEVSASDGNLNDGTIEDGTRLMDHAPKKEWTSLLRAWALTTCLAALIIAASLIEWRSAGGKSGVSSCTRDIISSTSCVISNTSSRS